MSFHQYRINELYGDASGTVQFIELSVGNFNGESQWSGVTISSTRNGVTHSFTFPSNLPSSATANTTVLIATQGFAALGVVTPNYIVPDGFLFAAGGTLNFGGADTVAYGALPSDGVHSLNRNGTSATATPKNFAGATGSLPAPLTPLNGTGGDDTLTGTTRAELIDGGAGNDKLKTGGGNDTVRGNTGDDELFSGSGNDVLDGGDGYDYLYFTEATAGVQINLLTGTATGGAGNDSFSNVELLFGSAFDDSYTGSNGADNFLGGDGNDTLNGGAGNDRLEGNGGNDVIDGGDERDQVAYYSAAFAVNVNLSTGTATGGLGNDTLRNIEDAIGSVFGDTFTGSAGDNRLEGGGADVDGDDTFHSTAGNDLIIGGAGLDAVVYTGARSTYTLRRAADGEFSVEKPDSAGSDTLATVERLHFSDQRLALDLNGHAGQTAKLLGAVFGPASVSNQVFAGIGLSMLDSGTSYQALATLAVQATGLTSHADIVALLWTNLFGSAPSAADAAPFVAQLDGGQISIGALTVLAADLDLNTTRIDLVGLTQSGLAYTV
jgi:Ca2+-binding RTX toxin-like protein